MQDLRAALRADATAVAEALLGPPSKALSTRNTLRWGGRGSLALEIRGARKGVWFDHEAGVGGDMLGFVRHARSCSFPDALGWAKSWTGLNGEDVRPPPRPSPTPPDPSEETDVAAAVAKRIAAAQRLASEAGPVARTPGEYYLKQGRGIPQPATGWPGAIRWHAGLRALVAVATNADGQVRAVQRVHLTEDGQKVGA